MNSHSSILRDFTVDRRVWLLSAVAIAIGACGTVLAVVLLKAIALATNIFYYHRLSLASVSPAGSPLGMWMLFVPVMGGLIVGLMARFGSDKIRGHGIPEAIEAILLNGAKVQPSIALLKPISAAIAIGSGGPFGAEGPIIMTGGAFGSLVAQWMILRTRSAPLCWWRVRRPACLPPSPHRLPPFCWLLTASVPVAATQSYSGRIRQHYGGDTAHSLARPRPSFCSAEFAVRTDVFNRMRCAFVGANRGHCSGWAQQDDVRI